MPACVSIIWQTLTDLQVLIKRLVILSLSKLIEDIIRDYLLWVRYLNITDMRLGFYKQILILFGKINWSELIK